MSESDEVNAASQSPQFLRTNGVSVAWRNETHEPGRWFVIDEGRWTDEAEVAEWEVVS